MPNKITAITLSLVVALCSITIGCSPIENNARDAAAGLNGALVAAITQNQAACTASPTSPICDVIRRGISGQNALITSIETYCGWSTAAPPPDQLATCVPVKTAKAGLVAAIANANQLTLQLKGAF